MTSSRRIAARRRAALLLAALAVVAAVLALLACGWAVPAAALAAAAFSGGTVVLLWFHARLTDATEQLTAATERLAALEDELHQAYTDPVTGLPVRRVAEQYLTDMTGADFTIAVIDVNDLHGYNDIYTHRGGDAYLAAIAERLTETVPGGLVARLGGDEFLLATTCDSSLVADALDAAFDRPATIGHGPEPLRVSIGLSRTRGGDPFAALGQADRAMFAAKRGPHRIQFYYPDRDGLPSPTGVRPATRFRDQRSGRRLATD
ncbi:GGDEF domain-containing protein [Cryptosporangium minutisporangium]|uniref:GGDEF domain-containing protein n=1 Tax=Cryptosporangium minutisporangium TaxID=113569 RepID=A0ABP6SWJ1_9ACTN